MDRTAKLWDLKNECELATLGGHNEEVYDVAFSTDADRLITISGDGAAKVWDVPAVLRRNLLLRTSTRNWWLRMSADERLLASAETEGTIHIWDRLNRTPMHSIQTGSSGALRTDVRAARPTARLGIADHPWPIRSSIRTNKHNPNRGQPGHVRGNQFFAG